MQEILDAVKDSAMKDNRPSPVIYNNIKQLGTYMIMTNTLSKDNVIQFCSMLIRLYKNLSHKDG